MSVYFIRSGEFVKIGFSSDPHKRMAQLDKALAVTPVLEAVFPGARATEKKLHRYFAQHHVRYEWFKWCPEIAEVASSSLPDLSHIGPEPRSAERLAAQSVGMKEAWAAVKNGSRTWRVNSGAPQ